MARKATEAGARDPEFNETPEERYLREAEAAGVAAADLEALRAVVRAQEQPDQLRQAAEQAAEAAVRAQERAELAQEAADLAQDWADEDEQQLAQERADKMQWAAELAREQADQAEEAAYEAEERAGRAQDWADGAQDLAAEEDELDHEEAADRWHDSWPGMPGFRGRPAPAARPPWPPLRS